jgi:hypothetical protein
MAGLRSCLEEKIRPPSLWCGDFAGIRECYHSPSKGLSCCPSHIDAKLPRGCVSLVWCLLLQGRFFRCYLKDKKWFTSTQQPSLLILCLGGAVVFCASPFVTFLLALTLFLTQQPGRNNPWTFRAHRGSGLFWHVCTHNITKLGSSGEERVGGTRKFLHQLSRRISGTWPCTFFGGKGRPAGHKSFGALLDAIRFLSLSSLLVSSPCHTVVVVAFIFVAFSFLY